MNREDKELLIKDLSARWPYGVKFLRESWNYELDVEVLEDIDKDGYINPTIVYRVKGIKPYLRPMSSMTEEEIEEFTQFDVYAGGEYIMPNYEAIDWLNKNMFDYRGLIPKGLAIEVTEQNNPYKD